MPSFTTAGVISIPIDILIENYFSLWKIQYVSPDLQSNNITNAERFGIVRTTIQMSFVKVEKIKSKMGNGVFRFGNPKVMMLFKND